jgi:hypothetical protein
VDACEPAGAEAGPGDPFAAAATDAVDGEKSKEDATTCMALDDRDWYTVSDSNELPLKMHRCEAKTWLKARGRTQPLCITYASSSFIDSCRTSISFRTALTAGYLCVRDTDVTSKCRKSSNSCSAAVKLCASAHAVARSIVEKAVNRCT